MDPSVGGGVEKGMETRALAYRAGKALDDKARKRPVPGPPRRWSARA